MTAWDLRALPNEYEPDNACSHCGKVIESDEVWCSAACLTQYEREEITELLEGRA